jgi:hypothetical protein
MTFLKHVVLFVLMLSLLTTLAACDAVPTAGHGTPAEDFPLFFMVMVGVVGGESAGYVKRLEEDAYGRIFFEFALGNLLNPYYDNGIRGYGICQKIEDGYAYYYEDVFYVGAKTVEEIEEDRIEELKQINDWNQELQSEKPLARIKSFTERYDDNILDISKKEVQAALNTFGTVMGLDSKTLKQYDISYSCRDADGKVLYYIATGENRHESGSSKTSKLYAIIIDPNTQATGNAILQIEDPYDCLDALREFKAMNGWKTPQ